MWRIRFRKLFIVAFGSSGLACLYSLYSDRLIGTSTRMTDFTGLIAGAHLVGTPGLYDLNANLEVQRGLVGIEDPARVFPRWPYFAAALTPIARLPYSQGARLWQASMVAAFITFALIFPITPKWVTVLALCWSIPAFDALGQGQDSPLLLIFLALTIRLHRSGHPFAAGAALSLCAAKYHLFVLTPLLIVMQRRWSFLAGGLLGGATLILASSLVQGPSWPIEHVRNISRPAIDAKPEIMPNVRGAVHSFRRNFELELTIAAGVASWIAWLLRRVNFEQGLSLVLVGGILVSHHAYIHDCIVLIPACLTLGATLPMGWGAAAIVLSPFALILLSSTEPLIIGTFIYVQLLLWLLGWVQITTSVAAAESGGPAPR